MVRFLILFLSFFNIFICYSQNKINSQHSKNSSTIKFTGSIFDEKTKTPIHAASILIVELKIGAVSNNNGCFTIPSIAKGIYTIEISCVGFTSLIEKVHIEETISKNFYIQEAAVEQEAITITGTSTVTRISQMPQTVQIIKKAQLLEVTSTNIIDALTKKVPGFNSLNTGPAVSKPIIRGLGYNRVITINDGVRQEGQQWGDEHGIEVDELSIQRAEVLKGAASLMYGSDAMAGVLNLITNVPLEKGAKLANVQLQTNTNNDLVALNGNYATHQQSGLNYNAYVSLKSAKDYINKYDYRVFNSRFNEYNFGGYIGVNKSWGHSHVVVSSFNQQLGIVTGERDSATGRFSINSGTLKQRIATDDELNSRQLNSPYQHIHHFKVSSDNALELSKGRITLNVGYQNNKRKEFDENDHSGVSTTAIVAPILFFDLSTLTYNAVYHSFNKNIKASYGINGMYQWHKNRGLEKMIPNYSQFDIGAFIYLKKNLKKIQFSGGLRWDNRSIHNDALLENNNLKFSSFKTSFMNVSGSAGLTWQTSTITNVKINVARGFRAPTLSELMSNGAHEGTRRFEVGNKDLQVETSLQFDGAFELKAGNFNFSFTPFFNRINNFIFYGKLANAAGADSVLQLGTSFVNVFTFRQNTINLYGIEANVDIKPLGLRWLNMQSSFSFVKATFVNEFANNKHVPFMPPARWLNEIKLELPKIRNFIHNAFLKFEVDHSFEQQQVFTAFNTETATSSFSILNLGWANDFVTKNGKKICSLNISINNITDVAYQNHLSRLKYTATNNVTNRVGVFNMGRNISVKLNFPVL
jgi:iron complex outermembrane recepter protein